MLKDEIAVCSEAAFHELGVYSKNDGNAVGIFSPKNVRDEEEKERRFAMIISCILVSSSR